MTGNVMFSNNTAGIFSSIGKEEPSGAAVYSQNSHINLTDEMILFIDNRAAESGGAQGNIIFNNNSAIKRDAIYINRNSCLAITNLVTISSQTTAPAPDNGAIYIDGVTNISKTIP